ncbi:hypothetical protein ElyMa_006201500 [Elysia marginata]|uniref:Uncharacterized protein n=1 Tax=Elysia marginata TaxID=1093978 RepID=A0AAV4H488_9GAST|nr:hypothetical protein ElyMa_006201500 [Elysia marginata]
METIWTHIKTRSVHSGNEAMHFYFVENKRPRGRPITTHSVPLNYDLKHSPSEKMTLTSQKDLDLIRDIAENRDEYRIFIAEIRRGAAEAVRSDDPTSERLSGMRLAGKQELSFLVERSSPTQDLKNNGLSALS